MKRGQLYGEIEELDISDEFKELLKHFILFIDEEDETTYGMMKRELEKTL